MQTLQYSCLENLMDSGACGATRVGRDPATVSGQQRPRPLGDPCSPGSGGGCQDAARGTPAPPLPSWAPCTLSSGCHLPPAEEPAILRTLGARPRRRGARRAL